MHHRAFSGAPLPVYHALSRRPSGSCPQACALTRSHLPSHCRSPSWGPLSRSLSHEGAHTRIRTRSQRALTRVHTARGLPAPLQPGLPRAPRQQPHANALSSGTAAVRSEPPDPDPESRSRIPIPIPLPDPDPAPGVLGAPSAGLPAQGSRPAPHPRRSDPDRLLRAHARRASLPLRWQTGPGVPSPPGLSGPIPPFSEMRVGTWSSEPSGGLEHGEGGK